MLTVNHFEMIRRKVLLDGHSQRDVARELGHSRKTVAKALEHAIPLGYRMGQARVSPVMDAFRPVIEQWMESDKTAPPKQRHTAQRMFERLRDKSGLNWTMAKTAGKESAVPRRLFPLLLGFAAGSNRCKGPKPT